MYCPICGQSPSLTKGGSSSLEASQVLDHEPPNYSKRGNKPPRRHHDTMTNSATRGSSTPFEFPTTRDMCRIGMGGSGTPCHLFRFMVIARVVFRGGIFQGSGDLMPFASVADSFVEPEGSRSSPRATPPHRRPRGTSRGQSDRCPHTGRQDDRVQERPGVTRRVHSSSAQLPAFLHPDSNEAVVYLPALSATRAPPAPR